MTVAKLANPKQNYYQLKRYVDKAVSYKPRTLLEIRPNKILSKEISLSIPIETPPALWEQLAAAQRYGSEQGVDIVIHALKGLK